MRKNKLNIKISKKHIIIACLTLFLAIAVYSNYWISQNSGLQTTDVIEGVNLDDDYGEVLYVNGTEYLTYSSDDYFAQARLDKATSRDEAVETFAAATSEEASPVEATASESEAA